MLPVYPPNDQSGMGRRMTGAANHGSMYRLPESNATAASTCLGQDLLLKRPAAPEQTVTYPAYSFRILYTEPKFETRSSKMGYLSWPENLTCQRLPENWPKVGDSLHCHKGGIF